jgi:hypothetical protein
MKTTPTKTKANQKAAWQKKYGKRAGDLLLKYRGKIAARARHSKSASKKTK